MDFEVSLLKDRVALHIATAVPESEEPVLDAIGHTRKAWV